MEYMVAIVTLNKPLPARSINNKNKVVGSRWQSRRMVDSSSPRNTSKQQLHMDRLTEVNLRTSGMASLQPRLQKKIPIECYVKGEVT